MTCPQQRHAGPERLLEVRAGADGPVAVQQRAAVVLALADVSHVQADPPDCGVGPQTAARRWDLAGVQVAGHCLDGLTAGDAEDDVLDDRGRVGVGLLPDRARA